MTINVSFYNKEHERLLSATPNFDDILKIINSGLAVDADLWVYALFKEQKDRDGFRTYSDFTYRLARRIQLIEDYIDLKSNTITSVDENPEKIITEYIGVGCALKLVSEIHGLTEADWELIPESRTKDLDFFISSDGINIVEVECKGTFLGSSRSSMKADIEKKKHVQRNKENNNHLLYGVITSYYSDQSKLAQAEILDPDPIKLYDDPYRARLLNRLRYYLIQFNIFSKAHFLISLSERINILRYTESYRNLDNVPLVSRYGEPFKNPVSFNWKKPFNEHSEIIGNIFAISEEVYLFYGLNENIIDTLMSQSYDRILDYREQPKTIAVSVEIQAPLGQQLSAEININFKGNISQNSAGRYIGILRRT